MPKRRPAWLIYSAIGSAMVIGIIAGMQAGRSSVDRTPNAEEAAFKKAATVSLVDILSDSARRGYAFGVTINERDLHGFMLQGMDSFSIGNLRTEARMAGEGPPLEIISYSKYKEFKRTPYRCVLEGELRYYTYLGKEHAKASECWAMSTESRLKNKQKVLYYIWERLQWVKSKQQWGLFDPAQERRFYEAYINRHYSSEAEYLDIIESNLRFQKAGEDKTLKRTALAAAYRTRVRRAGALYRLEHL